MLESSFIDHKKSGSYFISSFTAMASPCEVLIDTDDIVLAKKIGECVAEEALRIEKTFSRYRADNLIFKINNSKGTSVKIDSELSSLFQFADTCYNLSDGLFDITSGVLRRVWKFDGSDKIPSRKQAKSLLPLIGWNKVNWDPNQVTLPEGMEIDLGGIGKEYAVDSAAGKVSKQWSLPVLINFGGDLFATKAPNNKQAWEVGIESLGGSKSYTTVKLKQGGLATSGDARKFLLKKGLRYSHILSPRTAWPVNSAPSSITVAADRCIEAGYLSTLAMLKGRHAESFLNAQDCLFWIQK